MPSSELSSDPRHPKTKWELRWWDFFFLFLSFSRPEAINPLVPRVQKIKIRHFTLNRLLIVEFVKKKIVYLGAHYGERQGLNGLNILKVNVIEFFLMKVNFRKVFDRAGHLRYLLICSLIYKNIFCIFY